MTALLFVSNYGSHPSSIATVMTDFIKEQLMTKGIHTDIFNLNEADIPLMNLEKEEIPDSVKKMTEQFLSADLHFWLAPLYHGSIPGAMKNCLDWLETTAHLPKPYLTDKLIGLICWADGAQALNGISTMENIVKSLRAWAVPYTLPIVRQDFFDSANPNKISLKYSEKLNLLMQISISRKINKVEI